MGKLAKIAIVHGKKVPVSEASSVQDISTSSPFILSLLEHQGFLGIAEKISSNIVLSPREIESLLAKATLPVLMKLAEMRLGGQRHPESRLTPILCAPIENMLVKMEPDEIAEVIIEQVQSYDIPGINVYCQMRDFSDLSEVWSDFFEELREACPDVVIVGPSLDSMFSWLTYSHGRIDPESAGMALENLVIQLRELGVSDLAISSSRKLLRVGYAAGFKNSLCTRLETFPSYRLLAREYARIQRTSVKGGYFSEWSVGYISASKDESSISSLMPDVAMQLSFIRSFLSGVISIDGLHSVGVYSRYLNADTISFLHNLGVVNNFYTAVDRKTSDKTGLLLYSDVKELFANKKQLTS